MMDHTVFALYKKVLLRRCPSARICKGVLGSASFEEVGQWIGKWLDRFRLVGHSFGGEAAQVYSVSRGDHLEVFNAGVKAAGNAHVERTRQAGPLRLGWNEDLGGRSLRTEDLHVGNPVDIDERDVKWDRTIVADLDNDGVPVFDRDEAIDDRHLCFGFALGINRFDAQLNTKIFRVGRSLQREQTHPPPDRLRARALAFLLSSRRYKFWINALPLGHGVRIFFEEYPTVSRRKWGFVTVE